MKRIIVGVSGASGTQLAAAVLERIKERDDCETYLIMTEGAERTAELEYVHGPEYIKELADVVCEPEDTAHSIASGSFRTDGMIIVPCSMKTLAGIVNGYSENLLLRAADVTIKEGRKLVVVPREAPLSRVHCRNLLSLSEIGATIIPPVMSFYNKPESIDDMVKHIACKILDSMGLYENDMERWENHKF